MTQVDRTDLVVWDVLELVKLTARQRRELLGCQVVILHKYFSLKWHRWHSDEILA